MPKNHSNEHRLNTWKEIAQYLGCGVRTCRRWEIELGLPVHRVRDSGKSRVYAHKDEIDEWLNVRRQNNSHPRNNISIKKIFIKKIGPVFLIPVLLGLFYVFYNLWENKNPKSFKIVGTELVILNEKDKEIWRFDTKVNNLVTEEEYLNRSQFKRRNSKTHHVYLPYVSIEDLDNDSKKEVLFSIQTQDNFNEGLLLCFNHKGKELWRFQGGKELTFGNEKFSHDYRIDGFGVEDLDNDSNMEILVISDQRYFYPTQMVVLDNSGEMIGEYWNSGRLTDFVCKDLDEDGHKEIIVAGMNNEYKKAALIVFDSTRVDGASPQGSDYKCSELSQGTEKYYVLFPRTDVDRLDNLLETILSVKLLQGRRLSVLTKFSNIFFELDYNLEIKEIHISNSFEQNHRNAVKLGRISSSLNEEYLDNLKNGLLYYDGESWVPQATVSNPWPDSSN